MTLVRVPAVARARIASFRKPLWQLVMGKDRMVCQLQPLLGPREEQ
jgi:hypothetical protein